jgi:hypothetical protein
MKENWCKINFVCYEDMDCVYSTDEKNDKCQYFFTHDNEHRTCCSKVAQVNRMVLELQEMTGKKVELN